MSNNNTDKKIELITEAMEQDPEFHKMILEAAKEENLSAPVPAEDFIKMLENLRNDM